MAQWTNTRTHRTLTFRQIPLWERKASLQKGFRQEIGMVLVGYVRVWIPGGRGNFAVVGRQKSSCSGAVIGPNSLFCFTLIACNFEICAEHRRLLLLQQAAAQDAARTAVHESSGAVRSRKGQCQALPDNPETGDISHVK